MEAAVTTSAQPSMDSPDSLTQRTSSTSHATATADTSTDHAPVTQSVEQLDKHSSNQYVRWLRTAGAIVGLIVGPVAINMMILLLQPFIRTPLRHYIPFNAVREGRRTAKEIFGCNLVLEHQWFAPTAFHFTTDDDLPLEELFESGSSSGTWGDLRLPKRLVLIANHQVYPDFVFVWIFAYLAKAHGSIMIFLKDGFKNAPFIGWGMQFLDFVFLRRRWDVDRESIIRRVQLLKSDWEREDPLTNTREAMIRYAEKEQITTPLPKHCLLPRITGIQHILKELQDGDVDYLYDITIGFEGVNQALYTLRSVYMLGKSPPGIHLHVRRWHIPTQVPAIDGTDTFTHWLRARWMEKDELLSRFYSTGTMAKGDTPAEQAANTVVRPIALRNTLLENLPMLFIILIYIVIWRVISNLIW
ncbi:hypothetical protein BDF22DRAFT_683307 [Syncephalis plumigaleata]|nr:hypothetical protein BDF22DRAFT_683307 [Syncephalis plumigaleata]